MASTKRKQLVNQLRQAHFPFGFSNNKDAQSEYIERYKQYEIKLNQQKLQNARKVNFQVSDPNGTTNYQSQFKQKYPQHQLNKKQDPLKNKKQQIDKNFIFGYDPNNFDTNYKDDYTKKQGNNYQKVKPINQRQPNISLGDSLTDFTTTYNNIHNEKQLSKRNGIDPQLARKSNMILGNNNTNYITQNNATYKQKPINNYHSTQKSNISSINFGGDTNNFISQHKNNYLHKQCGPQYVDKAKIRDFRSAHFQFGFPQNNQYLSQNKAKYDEKPINYQKVQGNRTSNIHLKPDDNTNYDSTYKNQYIGKPGQRSLPIKKQGQINSILMGADKNPNHYITQSKSQFNKKQQYPQRIKPNKPINSLDIGKGQGNYLTHNQDIHTDKFGQRQNSKLSKQQLARLKNINFVTGFQNNDYGLSSQKYGEMNGPANKLPNDVLASMKKANIVQNGQNPFMGGTTYKAGYYWKKGQEEY